MKNDVMLRAEARNTTKDTLPEFEIGDTVDVHVKIQEGDKSRIQVFTGTVIAMRGGGLRRSFTVRRLVDGEGVERTFPIHSPSVVAVKPKRHGVTHRAKLYYLRDRVGKATRLKERIKATKASEETKKRGRKRGAKAKAERKARQAAAGAKKKKKGKAKKAQKTEASA
ncbi:MAG: 50S ribosomal protein L19 [Planctomycetota bacterium]|nr:MAG: 50S ribosomal protein L19 [Planctomycetota bacterium]